MILPAVPSPLSRGSSYITTSPISVETEYVEAGLRKDGVNVIPELIDGVELNEDEDEDEDEVEAAEERFKIRHRSIILLAGLSAPFSVLLDIPGLTERWYVRTEGFKIIETHDNPTMVTVAMSLSIAFGLVANISLISRFMEKRVRLSTWLAILFLSLHDIINILTIIIFGFLHNFINNHFTYGDAFYMTIAATVASLICNIILIIDLCRTREFSKHGSGLTEKQRALVAAVMILMCYIGLGSLAFSYMLSLTYINSLYFTICTITSVGFGDIVPFTLASKIFSLPFDIFGLVLLAFTISIARGTVIEKFEDSYRHRRGVLAVRAEKRKVELRKRVLDRKERREKGEKEGEDDTIDVPFITSSQQRTMDFEDELAAGVGYFQSKFNSYARLVNLKKPLEHPIKRKTKVGKISKHHHHHYVQEQEYVSFKRQMAKEQQREFQLKIGIALGLFFIFWFVGAAVFHVTEGWTYFIALYFCYIFFTTIGYGDYHPVSQVGRAFFVAWSILGIATMTLLLSVITESWSYKYRSSMDDAKAIRTIRRATKKVSTLPSTLNYSRTPTQVGFKSEASQLLAVEGSALDEEDLTMESFGEKIVGAIKGFSNHASYFMHGRTGDTPPSLRSLIDAHDEFDDELIRLKNGGYGEAGSHAGTRHFLFMISYERSFDTLLHLAERLSSVFTSHSEELETMRLLNEQLRDIIKSKGVVPADQQKIEDDDEKERYGISPTYASLQTTSVSEQVSIASSLVTESDNNR